MNILIYTHGNHDVGMGHVYRMLNLAGSLQKKNHAVTFLIPSDKEAVVKVQQYGYPLIQFPVSFFENEKEYEKKICNEYSCIIVDALAVSEKIIRLLKNKSRFLLSFDNLGEGRYHTDLLINILYKKESPLQKPQKELNNFEYLLLNPNYSKYNTKPKKIPRYIKKILISQGGADTHGIIPQLLYGLDDSTQYIFYIVLGPAFQHHSALHDVLRGKKLNYVILEDTTEPWDVFCQMDLAITGGGMTLFELLCLGVPCITLTGERKELETIDAITSMGLVCNFGFYNPKRKNQINEYIQKIANNHEYRKSLSEQSRKIIDGRGCERVVQIIETAIDEIE